MDVTLDPTAQAVYALMQKPGQSTAVWQACREALRLHGVRETVVLRAWSVAKHEPAASEHSGH